MSIEKKREEIILKVTEKFGFVPNLLKELTLSPAVAETYLKIYELMEEASLTQKDIHSVAIAISAENGCTYCVKAHSAVGKQVGIALEDLELIKDGKDPEDERLKAVVKAARVLHEKRGWLDAKDITDLHAQGIDKGQLYEIITIIAHKTISNYVNHIAGTKIDKQFLEGAGEA